MKYDIETIQTYIENHGDKCPNAHCRSTELDVIDEFREYNIEGGLKVEREILCLDCRDTWMEVFVLDNIQ